MENTFLKHISRSTPHHRLVPLGIGDDAAILGHTDNLDTVVTTDMLCDGVHFLSDEVTPELIGRKALAVNLSDIAAMTATPVAAFVSLALPRDLEHDYVYRLMNGIRELADEFDVAIAGGDTNSWDGKLAINVCLSGIVARRNAKLRSTAEPGDWILVTGELGGSILGRHLTFRPRVDEALKLAVAADINACMDISDGLLLDLSRMMEASNTGAVLDYDQIPISPAARQRAIETGLPPIEHALSDGEDFELLFTLPAMEARTLLANPPFTDVRLSHIGKIIGEASGLFRRVPDGNLLNVQPKGFEHEWHP
ncbi:MAG: thiamine-phosphate kinase [Planctomycetales bacterium]|nr:thiamine-phosphate kinase [Planctomycetales bacterium]